MAPRSLCYALEFGPGLAASTTTRRCEAPLDVVSHARPTLNEVPDDCSRNKEQEHMDEESHHVQNEHGEYPQDQQDDSDSQEHALPCTQKAVRSAQLKKSADGLRTPARPSPEAGYREPH